MQAQQYLQNKFKVWVPVISISLVLIILSILLITVHFGAVEDIEQNPIAISICILTDFIIIAENNSHKPCEDQQAEDNSMASVVQWLVTGGIIER